MENTQVKKRNPIFTILRFILFVGLGVFFIWLSLRDLSKEDMRAIWDSMGSINHLSCWLLLISAAIMAILADVARAVRAKILIEPLGYKPRFSMVFYSVMICYLANLALPRLGEILRCSFLQRFENVPFQKSLGTVLTERAVDILCWLTLILVVIGMNTGMLSNVIIDHETQTSVGMWMEQKGLSILGNYFIYILIGAIVLIWLLLRLTRRWWSKYAWCMKIRNFFVGLWQGIISIKDLPHPGRYIFWTVVMWICYYLGTYLCFFAIPYLHGLGPGAALAVLTFGTIAFMISQGGLGSYPLITAGILLMYGVNYTHGLAAGWIGWILQTAVSLLVGFASLFLSSFYKKQDSSIVKPETES